jgi:hypothetical protein
MVPPSPSGFSRKLPNLAAVQIERAETARRDGGGQSGLLAVGAVKVDRGRDIDVSDPVAIGHAKGVFAGDMLLDPQQSPAGHGRIARVHQSHVPVLRAPLVNFHAVFGHSEGYVRHVEEVIGEIFLDDVAFVPAADHEIVDAVVCVDLHDVPQDRPPADLDHRLGAHGGFFTEARAEAAGKNHCFHDRSTT